jgi:hypothetical protein
MYIKYEVSKGSPSFVENNDLYVIFQVQDYHKISYRCVNPHGNSL